MNNYPSKAHFILIMTLLIPSICSAAGLSLPFMEIIVYLASAVAILVAIALIITHVFFLSSISEVLYNCDEQSAMPSSFVWFNLIPIFNFFWMIYTVIKVSESIEKKFEAEGVPDPSKGAKIIGLTYSISMIIVPFIAVASVVALISWFTYWAKIRACNKAICAF